MGIRNVLVLPDIHVPSHDKRTIDALLQYARTEWWDEVVLLGDLMDFDYLAKFNKGKFRKLESKRIKKDYDVANKLLDEIQDSCNQNPHVSFTLIQGNHDERIERYIHEHPELEGMVEVENGLDLKGRGWNWVPYASKGTPYKIGKALFIHGIYVGDRSEKQHVEAYGKNVFFGHVHSMASYAKRSIGDNDVKVGQSLGCLCKYKPYYLAGFADRWQQGFGVFHFLKSGYFNYYPVAIFNHGFVAPDGVEYRG